MYENVVVNHRHNSVDYSIHTQSGGASYSTVQQSSLIVHVLDSASLVVLQACLRICVHD